jgi:hypothetical protein
MTFPFDSRIPVIGVEIDWNDDGAYTGAYDDVSADVLADPGITIQYGRDQARSFAPPMVPSCDFVLRNEDGKYSPENAASPIAQLVKPGRGVRVFAYHGERRAYTTHATYSDHAPYRGIARYPQFTGNIDTLHVDTQWGNRVVTIAALGRTALLKRAMISIPLLLNLPTYQAVGQVLQEAGYYPANDMLLFNGDTIFDVWWVDERPAWDVLIEILASEGPGGMIYENPDGSLSFYGRTTREFLTTSTTPVASFYESFEGASRLYTQHTTYSKPAPYRSGQGLYYVDFSYDPRWEDVIDRATVAVKQRVAQATTVVWKLGSPLALNPSEVRTIYARPSDPFQAAVTPVLATDYTVTGGTVTVGMAWTGGAVAVLTITATSGGPTVNDLQLRAQPYTVVGETTVEAIAPGASSIPRTYNIAAWPELDPGQADGITQATIDRYHEPLPRISLTIVNVDVEHAVMSVFLQPSWRLSVTNRPLGMQADVWIEQVTRHFGAGGLVTATYGCERVVDIAGSGASLWESALWDSGTWGL